MIYGSQPLVLNPYAFAYAVIDAKGQHYLIETLIVSDILCTAAGSEYEGIDNSHEESGSLISFFVRNVEPNVAHHTALTELGSL